jgi:hypothetical protein
MCHSVNVRRRLLTSQGVVTLDGQSTCQSLQQPHPIRNLVLESIASVVILVFPKTTRHHAFTQIGLLHWHDASMLQPM